MATARGSDETVLLADDEIDALAGSLRGPLLRPGELAYEEHRTVWNAMIDRHPRLIAQCLGVGDVVQCVNFAREHSLPLSVKGGGHNIAGLAVSDGALTLDMSAMRGVWTDPSRRRARAQAGCLLGDVDRETQLHGLAAVLGFVSNTGIAGLTLGGGFGYLTRKYGWTSDNLRAVELVTADGRVVTASESQHPDLFWGLRGGGGNFGVATGFDYALHPVGPEIMAGAIAWRAEEAGEILSFVQALSHNAPRELSIIVGLRKAPPAPWIDSSVHGQSIVALFVCHSGSLEEGQQAVAPLKALGRPVGDVLQPRPYAQQQALIDATQPKGRRYYWKSEYLGGLEDGLLQTVQEHAGRIESPHSAILLFPFAGALNELPTEHSAVGNRDSRAVVNIAGSWEDAADDLRHMGWVREAHAAVERYSTGGTYVNFLAEDEGAGRTRAAYRDNYERLVAVKKAWDPDNFFRINKNIMP